ncbi:MAG TPA: hypothetical protein VF018_04940 [Acidobacteriaceae bacterium]
MSTDAQHKHSAAPGHHAENAIHLPAPTQWPLIMAVGLTLLFAGLVTNFMISVLGIVMAIAGAVGWFRQVLPHEAHEMLPVTEEEIAIEREGRRVTRFEHPVSGRSTTPVSTYPISSGIKGGFAGGTVMIVLAEIYGVVRFHSIWYVVNLLGGAGVTGWNTPSEHDLAAFHLAAFLIAIVIHTASSFLVGLLYGALLPIMPRHPIVLGGLIAPALWTGLLHSTLGLLNPFFDNHINWYWFALSQVGFGLVAGWVVAREGRLKSLQGVPLSVRLGVERPESPRQDDEGKR